PPQVDPESNSQGEDRKAHPLARSEAKALRLSVAPDELDQKTPRGIKQKVIGEHDPIRPMLGYFLPFRPVKVKPQGDQIKELVKLGGMQWDIERGQGMRVREGDRPGQGCLGAITTAGRKTTQPPQSMTESDRRSQPVHPFLPGENRSF